MPSPAPLSESELERLSAALASDDLPQAIPIDALQGAVYAWASAGGAFAPAGDGAGDRVEAKVLHAFAFGDDATWRDDATRADVEGLVTRFAAECERDLFGAEDSLPLLLFDDDAGRPDHATWCRGYIDGLAAAEAGDDALDALDDLLLPIEVLAAEPGDAAQFEGIGDFAAFRREAARDLVDVVLEIRDAFFDARTPRTPLRRDAPKVGRNDPCPCGSGRKFKQCHGRED